MSKRADAPYREGRGGDWRKAKCRLSQEVVIGGWTLPVGRPARRSGRSTWASTRTASSCTRARSAPASPNACSKTCCTAWRRRQARHDARSPPFPPRCSAAPTGWSRISWPRSSSRSGRTRAGCASRCSSAFARTAIARHVVRERPGTVEGGGVDTVAAGRPWEALRHHATRTRAASGEEIVELLGVRLTHPDRIYYPDLGFTKLDLALYYVTDRRRRAAPPRGPAAHPRALPGRARRRDVLSEEGGLLDAAPDQALRGPGKSRGAPLRGLGAGPRGPGPGRHPRDPPLELTGGAPRAAGPGDLRPRPRRVAALLPGHRGGPARAGPPERARPGELREDDGGQGPARVRAARCRSAAGRSWRSSRGRWRSGSRATSRGLSPRTWPRRSGRARSTWTTCATSGAPTPWASTPRGPSAGAPVSVPVDWDELDRLSGPKDFTVAEVPLRVLG